MNKDNTLKKEETKLILLLVGNSDTGKKSIAKQWLSKTVFDYEEHKTFYKTFHFTFEDFLDDERISIPGEIRVLNGDEIETDMKANSSFFKGALGAFIVTNIEDYISFQDGVRWKEKVDLMCCLPNRFPLPIFLLINKCDKIARNERRPWLEKIQIDNYVMENQYCNYFFVSCEGDSTGTRETLQSSLSTNSVEIDSPFKEMVKTILTFKDIKEKLLGQSPSVKATKSNTKETSSSKRVNEVLDRKEKKCYIL